MSQSSLQISEMTEAQRAMLEKLAASWKSLDQATAPVDRELAESAAAVTFGKQQPLLIWLNSPVAALLTGAYLSAVQMKRDEMQQSGEFWTAVRKEFGDELIEDMRAALDKLPHEGRGAHDIFERVACGGTAAREIGATKWTAGDPTSHRLFGVNETARQYWWGSDEIKMDVILQIAAALGATRTEQIAKTAAELNAKGGDKIYPGLVLEGMFPRIEKHAQDSLARISSLRKNVKAAPAALDTMMKGLDEEITQHGWNCNLPDFALWCCCLELFGKQVSGDLRETIKSFADYAPLAQNVGWISPFENVCLLSERGTTST